jgi:hypothetical protein
MYLPKIQGDLPDSEVQSAFERGAALDLDQVLGELQREPKEIAAAS